MTRPENGLWRQLLERHPAACEAFVDAHYREVYRLLYWLTGSAESAEDLTQETFAAFWESLRRLGPTRDAELRPWLYGIARNRWRKARRGTLASRSEQPGLEVAQVLPDGVPGPEEQLLLASGTEQVLRALEEMPAEYREALVLRAFEELPYERVAELLGIGLTLARWRVHRARGWLRAALRSEEEQERKEESRATC